MKKSIRSNIQAFMYVFIVFLFDFFRFESIISGYQSVNNIKVSIQVSN